MRVLYLTMNPNRASTTVSMEGWFNALRPRGLEPVLMSHRVGALHAWAMEQGIAAYQVPLDHPSKSKPWALLHSLWRMRAVARRHRVQLIHCNEQDIYPIGQYLGRLSRLPCVVSVRSRIEPGFAQWAFRGARRPHRIFFVSRASLESCRASIEGLVPESDWRLLANAVDLEHYYQPDVLQRTRARAEYGLDGELAIGAACRLRPGKQLEHLIEAAARLSSRGIRLLLAGGWEEADEAYAARILEQGERRLGDRFQYLGHLDDVRGLMQALDIYVNTSREEACSISILEALASGCPVVGYPSVSVAEQILPSGGEIVAQDHIDQLAAALDRWLGEPARVAAARADARRRAEDGYDIVSKASQLWAEYESLAV